jgi:hypothetical protein
MCGERHATTEMGTLFLVEGPPFASESIISPTLSIQGIRWLLEGFCLVRIHEHAIRAPSRVKVCRRRRGDDTVATSPWQQAKSH